MITCGFLSMKKSEHDWFFKSLPKPTHLYVDTFEDKWRGIIDFLHNKPSRHVTGPPLHRRIKGTWRFLDTSYMALHFVLIQHLLRAYRAIVHVIWYPSDPIRRSLSHLDPQTCSIFNAHPVHKYLHRLWMLTPLYYTRLKYSLSCAALANLSYLSWTVVIYGVTWPAMGRHRCGPSAR